MSITLITHTKKDLERMIELVIERVRKTEMIPNGKINPEEDRLTQKEAADFLGISVTSIISWKKQGRVPYFQIGRSIFYSKSELLAIARKNPELVRKNH